METEGPFEDGSTVFYTSSSTEGADDVNISMYAGSHVRQQEATQQSFLFGADQFMSRKSTAHVPETPLLDVATTHDKRFLETDTQTNWPLVLRHWLLSCLFLPLYSFALVTHAWRKRDANMSVGKGWFVIVCSVAFYALLWTMIALLIAFPEMRSVFPLQGALFALFIYSMCCFAESLLKNTQIVYRSRVRVATDVTFTTTNGKEWIVETLLDTLLFLATPSRVKVRNANIATCIATFLYAAGVCGVHAYMLVTSLVSISIAAASVYIIASTLVHALLCAMIVHPLGQVVLRLSVRERVAKLFSASTSLATEETGDHHFQLTDLRNLRAWEAAREALAKRYAFPTLYVDVVISTAFTLWVPLVALAALDFVFRAAVSPLAMTTSGLAVIVLAYLLICTVLASQVQETLSDAEVLRRHEFLLLMSDEKEETHMSVVLRRMSKMIHESRDNAIVFQVWGFPLNRRMATFLGGVLVTLSSSLAVRLTAKVSTM